MNIMKPVVSLDLPMGDDWAYEIKYDGFRSVLKWTKQDISLLSKNNHDLTDKFPEIVDYCRANTPNVSTILPLTLDGELVILNHLYQANFSLIQSRAKSGKINKAAQFIAFDLLLQGEKSLRNKTYNERRQQLEALFKRLSDNPFSPLRLIHTFSHADEAQHVVFTNKSEGIIAKRKSSLYRSGKTHRDWIKVKNWRVIKGCLTAYNEKNGYFSVYVYDDDQLIYIGKCKHGLHDEEADILRQFFRKYGEKSGSIFYMPPAICALIHTLDLHGDELREPQFVRLLPEIEPKTCTIEQLKQDMAMFPTRISFTNLKKAYWQKVTKLDFLIYIREISPYMLPFLKNKAVTLIRSPDGIFGEHFYQKHVPSYAPPFIHDLTNDERIRCDDLTALLWYANHGAIEYHLPFQTVEANAPDEMVFDLDPPDREHFYLAVRAARLIKQMLDHFQLHAFVKTSGNKGIQIHIPIPEGSLSYQETSVFTKAVALTVEKQYPNLFTTERFIHKRERRLYLDYVQHGKNKTIIAPYSPRRTNEASVATPLFWEELTESFKPEQMTLKHVLERVKIKGCPFMTYHIVRDKQPLNQLLKMVRH